MKSMFLALTVLTAAGSVHATEARICGQAIYAMFDKNDPSNCVWASDTCEAADLKEKGYYGSANNRCPKPSMGPEICGQGGVRMNNPLNPKETVQTVNTCETADLKEMGWVEAQ